MNQLRRMHPLEYENQLLKQALQAAQATGELTIHFAPLPPGTLAVGLDTHLAELDREWLEGYNASIRAQEQWIDPANELKQKFAEQRTTLQSALTYGHNKGITDAIKTVSNEISKLLDDADVLNRRALDEVGMLALDAQSFMDLRDSIAEFRSGKKTLEDLAKAVLGTEDALPAHLRTSRPGVEKEVNVTRIYEAAKKYCEPKPPELGWKQIAAKCIADLLKAGHKEAAEMIKSRGKKAGDYIRITYRRRASGN
jgi:hypothetical protein